MDQGLGQILDTMGCRILMLCGGLFKSQEGPPEGSVQPPMRKHSTLPPSFLPTKESSEPNIVTQIDIISEHVTCSAQHRRLLGTTVLDILRRGVRKWHRGINLAWHTLCISSNRRVVSCFAYICIYICIWKYMYIYVCILHIYVHVHMCVESLFRQRPFFPTPQRT